MFSRTLFAEDLPTWALLCELLVAGTIVVLAGSRLTRLADRLAEERNIGRAWIGMLLLATVTSLPEVVAGCTAVVIGAADMAFATLLGSCSFNITLIVWFNVAVGGGSILGGRSLAHTLTSTRGIFMIALTLAGVTLVDKFQGSPAIAQFCEVGTCLLITVTYIQSIKASYQMEQAEVDLVLPDSPAERRTPGLVPKIVLLSAVLVGAAWWLAQTGDVLSTHPIELIGKPLGATFVGACFLAIASSLPEIVTGLAAVRIGQLDLALGNIFGSNMFNIFVVPMCKVASLARGDMLLMAGADFHPGAALIAGLLAILLTAVAVSGLTHTPQRRWLRLGPDSVLIGVFYLGGMILLLSQP